MYQKHVRKGRFERIRKSKRLLAALQAQGTRLTASATGITVSLTTVGVNFATGTFNAVGNPTNAQTLVIGAKTYTFQSALTNVDGNILIAGTLAATLTNIKNAINNSGGVPGTDYAAANTAHADVTATADATHLFLLAKAAGTASNAKATTGTAGGGAWVAATLLGGTDIFGPNVVATAHGQTDFEGPYTMTAVTTLPTGVVANDLLFLKKVDANNIKLARSKEALIDGAFLTFATAGVGTLTLKRSISKAGIHALLKKNPAGAVKAAADIDNLR